MPYVLIGNWLGKQVIGQYAEHVTDVRHYICLKCCHIQRRFYSHSDRHTRD